VSPTLFYSPFLSFTLSSLTCVFLFEIKWKRFVEREDRLLKQDIAFFSSNPHAIFEDLRFPFEQSGNIKH
jgi:hypothetical protein